MSYSIDFHFAPAEAPTEQWLLDVDTAMRHPGLRRLSNVQPLEIDEDGEIDTVFPIQHLESWDEIAALAASSFGVALTYASSDFDLALYAWRARGVRVACAMDYRQWRRLDPNGKFRVGGIMCAVAAVIGSSFGFSIVNSTLPPHDDLNLETLWAAFDNGSLEPELAWLADKVLDADTLRERCGPFRELRASLSGYHIVLSLGSGSQIKAERKVIT